MVLAFKKEKKLKPIPKLDQRGGVERNLKNTKIHIQMRSTTERPSHQRFRLYKQIRQMQP